MVVIRLCLVPPRLSPRILLDAVPALLRLRLRRWLPLLLRMDKERGRVPFLNCCVELSSIPSSLYPQKKGGKRGVFSPPPALRPFFKWGGGREKLPLFPFFKKGEG